jgi:signal transduction histidine kinase/CheY-like chemotaxis protein
VSTASRPLALDADESQAVDDRLALAGVLQELTVAALDLFEPSRSVDDFLQTVAARMGCRIAVCLDVKEGSLLLLGSAGLARASRNAPLPAVHTVAADGDVALPYLEIAPSLLRWIIRPEGPHAGTWWLLLYFDREPQLARQYKGMLERLARQVDCAFGHRRLYEMLLARERNLRVASSHLETMIAHLSSGILVVDEHAQIAQANEAFCRLVGIPSSSLIGANAGLMLDKIKGIFRNPQDFVERTAKAIEAGAVLVGEAPEELADGRVIVRDFVPILVDGAQVGRMWTFLDVTRTYRAAEEIRVLNEGLERRVAERTSELAQTQERLALSDRMASVGTLAAGVAHEINNPLAYITANLEMIVEELHDTGSTGSVEHVVAMAREAHEGAERVRRIVRGLKTFSRSDKEQRVAIDLHRVLEQSIAMAFNEIKHHACLEKDFGPAPVVEGDETRLGQVFINLLVNAAQAIPAGQAQSNTIRVVIRTDDRKRAVVEVHDTGPGISPEILSHVFDPFFTTKAVGVGTGLGLSICHGIVAALGGEITVESVLGRGTVVRVTLAAAPVITAPVAPSTPVEPQPQRRASVLIVDDDPMVRSALQRALKDHDVTTAADGLEALERIRAHPGFHLILCDLMMPDMSGMDLHAQLGRELPRVRERIVFMTGGAFTAQARSFLEAVTNERVEKPFNLATLRALVRRCMPASELKAAG